MKKALQNAYVPANLFLFKSVAQALLPAQGRQECLPHIFSSPMAFLDSKILFIRLQE